MPATSAIDIVSDANVALKWFHAAGEEVEAAHALLAGQRDRTVALRVLDLTAYEIGNALLRGRAKASAAQVATVLDALREICPSIAPTPRRNSATPRAWPSSMASPSTTRPTPRSPAAAGQRLPRWIASC